MGQQTLEREFFEESHEVILLDINNLVVGSSVLFCHLGPELHGFVISVLDGRLDVGKVQAFLECEEEGWLWESCWAFLAFLHDL